MKKFPWYTFSCCLVLGLFATAISIQVYVNYQKDHPPQVQAQGLFDQKLTVAAQQGIVLAPTTPWTYGPAGGVTQLPAGDIVLTSTLYIDNQFGPVIKGAGQFLTRIRWQGPPDQVVIALRNCNYAELSDFSLVFDKPALHGIALSNLPNIVPGTVVSTRCHLHHIWLDAGTSNKQYVTDGIRIDSSLYGGRDQNNEKHRIDHVTIRGFSGAGISILSTQSHQNVISDCQFANSQVVPSGTAVNARFGSQTMRNCNGGNLELVFAGSDQYAGAGIIEQNTFEGCSRFINCTAAGNQWVIRYNRCDGMSPHNCSDGDYARAAVYCDASGRVEFEDNFMASQTTVPLRLMFGRNQGLNFNGNRFNPGTAGKPRILPIYTGTDVVWTDYKWHDNTWQSVPGVNTPIPHP